MLELYVIIYAIEIAIIVFAIAGIVDAIKQVNNK
jgi:hypothetical protein